MINNSHFDPLRLFNFIFYFFFKYYRQTRNHFAILQISTCLRTNSCLFACKQTRKKLIRFLTKISHRDLKIFRILNLNSYHVSHIFTRVTSFLTRDNLRNKEKLP